MLENVSVDVVEGARVKGVLGVLSYLIVSVRPGGIQGVVFLLLGSDGAACGAETP
jgi:hypothetical protein